MLTVILNVEVAVFPAESLAVHMTSVVVPTVKSEPLEGRQSMLVVAMLLRVVVAVVVAIGRV